MKKQIVKTFLLVCFSLMLSAIFSERVWANGDATVWWTAPTTDEGGGALGGGTSDLAGYRIFYSTSDLTTNCTAWNNAADQTARAATALASVSHVDVTEANAMRNASDSTKRGYTFNGTNLLSVGSSYNFAVVAYDSNNNFSKCATGSGSVTSVPKANVPYAADINNSDALGVVNYLDYGTLHQNYGNTTCGNVADITGPSKTGACVVDYLDYGILHVDYR